MKSLFSKPLFWSNVAAFLVTGLVTAGVAVAWNNPSSAPTTANGVISADAAGNAIANSGLCFGSDCRGSWPFSNIQAFDTTVAQGGALVGTPWVVPAGVRKIIVEVWGGGAQGGVNYDVSGGGGGGYGKDILSVTPGETLTVYVGRGATYQGPAPTYTWAYNGETSSVSRGSTVLISATGGRSVCNTCSPTGSYQFTASGGTSSARINVPGGQGERGSDLANSGVWSGGVFGHGGSGGNGGVGGWGYSANGVGGSTCKANGDIPGGGGAGYSTAGSCGGSQGARGRVIIWY